MGAITPSTTRNRSAGSQIKYVFSFAASGITHGDTYASGLGARVLDYYFSITGDISDSNLGVKVANSSGTFTFHTDGVLDGTSDLVVFCTGA